VSDCESAASRPEQPRGSAYGRRAGATRAPLPDNTRRRLLRPLRILLPALIAVLIGLAVLLPEIFSRSGRAPIDVAVVEQGSEAEGKGMVNITYSGVDKEGRPFSLSANSMYSAPDRTDLLLLTRPDAQVLLKDGSKLSIGAESGTYDRVRELVDLQEQVTLRHGPDLIVRTSQASVDLEAGSAFGNQPVDGEASFGALTGRGFRIADGGDRIFVEGPAQLLIEPGAKPRLP
jgi:lipopolysaccharide export system protein LptC